MGFYNFIMVFRGFVYRYKIPSEMTAPEGLGICRVGYETIYYVKPTAQYEIPTLMRRFDKGDLSQGVKLSAAKAAAKEEDAKLVWIEEAFLPSSKDEVLIAEAEKLGLDQTDVDTWAVEFQTCTLEVPWDTALNNKARVLIDA